MAFANRKSNHFGAYKCALKDKASVRRKLYLTFSEQLTVDIAIKSKSHGTVPFILMLCGNNQI